ncbi:MAG: DUF4113 domain-containing protein [Pyrinomonadaceae bacterium]
MHPLQNWPNAVAHIDCDAFYASCERARRPELRSTPVCVLSNQDAFVVARTYDAKAVGIKVGTPVYEAKALLPNAVFLPADFSYYGQVSDQVFNTLRRFSPEVEVYSIDESFVGLNGIRSLHKKSFSAIADAIRDAVYTEIGITTSVGISLTKTLAKIASESNKPNGSTVVPGRGIECFLADIPVKDIPGIGSNREALLNKFKITTALEFMKSPKALIQRLMGKVGTDLRDELMGNPVYPLELEPKLPKSIARTASVGKVTSERDIMIAHLTHHTSRLALELVSKRYVAGRLVVFLRLKTFDSVGGEIHLRYPTSSYYTLSKAVMQAFDNLYKSGELYWGCGVIASEIEFAAKQTPDLFGVTDNDARQGQVMATVDEINNKYGRGTVKMLSTSSVKPRPRRGRFKYPVLDAS